MGNGIRIIRHIMVATGTGVGGIALRGTGGGGHNGGIAVSRCGRMLANVAVAASTGIGSIAVCRTGGSGNPCGIAVTGSRRLVINVGVTADAGVGREASARAGGGCNDGGILMTDRLLLAGLGMSAGTAHSRFLAILVAGRSLVHRPFVHGMAQGGNVSVYGGQAASTAMCRIALLGTGGRGDLIMKDMLGAWLKIAVIGITAYTGVGGITDGRTGGLGHDGCELMSKRGGIVVLIPITASADVGRIALM